MRILGRLHEPLLSSSESWINTSIVSTSAYHGTPAPPTSSQPYPLPIIRWQLDGGRSKTGCSLSMLSSSCPLVLFVSQSGLCIFTLNGALPRRSCLDHRMFSCFPSRRPLCMDEGQSGRSPLCQQSHPCVSFETSGQQGGHANS
jgi:hypothetical protein